METKSTYDKKLLDPRWQKKRLEILNRDNFTCDYCGDKESTLHVHHITYHGEPWEADDSMLQTVCKDCHVILEHIKKDRGNCFYYVKGIKVKSTFGELINMVTILSSDTLGQCVFIWPYKNEKLYSWSGYIPKSVFEEVNKNFY